MSTLIIMRRLALTATVAVAVGFGGAGCGAAGSAVPDTDVDLLADPSPANAQTIQCTAMQRWTALAALAPRVRDVLAAHPDLASELDRTRGLPRERRRAELRSYLESHPELAPQVQQGRQTLRQYRDTCAVG